MTRRKEDAVNISLSGRRLDDLLRLHAPASDFCGGRPDARYWRVGVLRPSPLTRRLGVIPKTGDNHSPSFALIEDALISIVREVGHGLFDHRA